MRIRAELEHPAQQVASAFLRAIVDGDDPRVLEHLSPQARGFLDGLHAARAGSGGATEVIAPLRASVLGVLGGTERVGRFGVSGARVVDRDTAYVLLLPEVEREGLLTEADWRPAYLLACVRGRGEWLIDLVRTRELSADAGLPDPFGEL